MRNALLSVLVSVLSLCVVACAASDTAADGVFAGSIDTLPSGRVVVSNTEQGLWTDDTRWLVSEDLRIGVMEGGGPDVFGRIGDIAVDSEGRIYVLESQAQEVRVFDSTGGFVRTIGRRGNGPGELENVSGIGWGVDGNLWVVDPGNIRTTVFDTTGVLIRNYRHQPGTFGFSMWPWPGGFDGDGRLIDLAPPTERSPDGVFRPELNVYNADMEIVGTFPIPRYEDAEVFELRRERSRASASVPFSSRMAWTLDPRGYTWQAITGDYRIHQVSWAGDTVLTISARYDPVPVTEAEIDEAIERLAWFTRQGGTIDRGRIPSHKGALSSMFLVAGDFLFVALVTEAETNGRVFDVFDHEGRLLGRLLLDIVIRTQGPTPRSTGNYIYAVTQDEFDVPYVVRLRIDKRG